MERISGTPERRFFPGRACSPLADRERPGKNQYPTRINVPAMATFILVHGGSMSADTWNRLAGREDYPPGGELGGKCWDGTVAALSSRGHRVFAPTLGDDRESNLAAIGHEVKSLLLFALFLLRAYFRPCDRPLSLTPPNSAINRKTLLSRVQNHSIPSNDFQIER